MRRWRPALALMLALHGVAAAATIQVVNGDGANEGFNDATVVAPVGGNPGTTLGAQRLNAFTRAAELWGELLTSAVVIRVNATMDPLTCTSMSATLGSAGTNTVHYNFTNAPYANTYYPQALANKIAGVDLTGTNDITAYFNSTIGTTCTFPKTWYYGLDGNPAASELDFVTVVMHEIGHGLGFQTFVSLSTGARFNDRDDVYMKFLEDHGAGLAWSAMNNAQRAASAIDTSDLHWTGSAVVAAGATLSAGRHAGGHVQMYAPGSLVSGSSVSHWDTALSPNELMEPSYTTAMVDPGLARALMTDLGWDFGLSTTTSTSTTSSTSTSATSTTTTSTSTSTSTTTFTTSTTAASTSTSTSVTSTTTSTSTSSTSSTSTTSSTTSTSTTTTTAPSQHDGPCAPVPLASCRVGASQRSSVQLRNAASSAKDVLKWRMTHGGPSLPADIVAADVTLALCIYDTGTPQLLLSSTIPTAGTCGGKPCWKPLGSGFRFKSKTATPSGIVDVKLQATGLGELGIVLKGKGGLLAMPALGLAPPVRVQLVATDDGGTTCWESSFASAQKNDAAQFKANGS